MDPTEKQKELKRQFDANLIKHAEAVLKLHARFAQATLGGIGMSVVVPEGSLGDTFGKAHMMFLADLEQKKHPGTTIDALKLYSEGYCEGLIMGVFLSETGLAALITREK